MVCVRSVMSVRCILSLLVALMLSVVAEGYQTGAPDDPDICRTMMPEHNYTSSRSDKPPYRLDVSQTTYTSGQAVNVTIVCNSTSWPMEGFLLIARRSSNNETIGTFTSIPSNAEQRCSGSGVTHSDKTKRNSTTFTWTAPAGTPPGDVYFIATVVRGWSRGFWTGLRSSAVVVAPSTTMTSATKTTAASAASTSATTTASATSTPSPATTLLRAAAALSVAATKYLSVDRHRI